MRAELGSITIECVQAEITLQTGFDAVVNAANAELMPGGGVAGAIHDAAGPGLAEACEPLAPIEPGDAVITDAFDLPNDHVIHCLGPVYGDDEPEAELLASCYRRALALAASHGVESIAFPAISTGAFGYPVDEAAGVAMRTIAAVAPTLERPRLIRFVLLNAADLEAHERALREAIDGLSSGGGNTR